MRRKNNEVREGSCRNDEMVCYKMRCRIIADLCPCGQKRRIRVTIILISVSEDVMKLFSFKLSVIVSRK